MYIFLRGEGDLEVDLIKGTKTLHKLLKYKKNSSKFARASETCKIQLFLNRGFGEKNDSKKRGEGGKNLSLNDFNNSK